VRAQAEQAGPGLDRGVAFPVSVEAAGPARPRLIIEEVTSRLNAEELEVAVTLALGPHRFAGTVGGRAGHDRTWELAAAASVAAMQQYLQQHASDPTTPQVQLLDVAAFTTGIGQEFIAARIGINHCSKKTDLLGSALVGNDRCRAAVAAALDATSRYLGRLRPPPVEVGDLQWNRDASKSVHQNRLRSAIRTAHVPPEAGAGRSDSGSQASVSEGPPPQLSEPEPVVEAEPVPRRLPETRPGAIATFPEPPAASPRSSPAGFPAIGVSISPTSIQASAVSSGGQIVADARRPTRAGMSSELILATASQAVREVLVKLDGACDAPTSIGLALPGRVVEREGTWIWSGDFPNWDDVPVVAPFAEDFGLPVAALSAGHAAAFAEFSFGAAQGIADILYVRVGIDIDAALLVRGRPFLVPQVSPGQAGHMVIESGGPRCSCGDSGCWQALAGREALIARVVKGIRRGSPSAVGASVDGQFGAITPALIVRMAGTGDAVARRALDETGRCLALGLANLIALFGPQAVIVESQPPAVGAALLRAAEKALKSSPRAGLLVHCVLLSPELGDSAPVLGAAAWAARSPS